MMMRRPWLHPWLLATAPVLLVYQHNIQMLRPSMLVVPLALAIGLAAILGVALRRWGPDRGGRRSAALASWVLVAFYGYGAIVYLLQWAPFYVGVGPLGPGEIALAICLGLIVIGGRAIRRTGRPLVGATAFLNVATLVIVATAVVGIVAFELTGRVGESPDVNRVRDRDLEPADQVREEGGRRDIYYLVFDRYASARTLRDVFDYDNDAFLQGLRDRGFYVAERSRANYPKTFESLASSLNMRHLTDLEAEIGDGQRDQTALYEMLQDHRVGRILQEYGYRYVHLGARWDPTHRNPNADVNHVYGASAGLDDFLRNLLQHSMLYPLLRGLWPEADFDEEQRRRVRFKFEKLADIPDQDGPTFAFAHFLVPHPPFVFDRECRPRAPADGAADSAVERAEAAYLDQLICLNGMIESLLDEILDRSPQDPIVILQSDEGPCEPLAEFQMSQCGVRLDWTTLSTDALRAHMEILNAVHLSGIDAEAAFGPDATPVNTFRLVFNHYFDGNYERLPDASYIFPGVEAPYRFIDVTDRLSNGDDAQTPSSEGH